MTNTYNIIYAVLIVGFFKKFFYFTMITKQAISLILIMLVGTDVCVRVVFVWEESGVPGGNSPVWLDDHMIISHAEVVLCCI